MANVTVTLPINMLDKLDDLIEKRKHYFTFASCP